MTAPTALQHPHLQVTEILGSQASAEPFELAKLVLNGQDRFAKPLWRSYFRTCQIIQAGHRVPERHLYASFALSQKNTNLQEHNFSRIDDAQSQFTDPVTQASISPCLGH